MKLSSLIASIFSKNRLIPFGLLLTALQILSGGMGYIYQIVMGRNLSPVEFALFSSIMALFMFLSAPIGAMSMLIVKKVSTLKACGNLSYMRPLFFRINKLLFMLFVVILFLIFLFGSHIEYYLKAESSTQVILFLLILILSFLTAVINSFLQGLQKFAILGIIGFLGMLGKLIVGTFLVMFGFGVEGALFGVLLPMILIGMLAVLILFRSLPKQIGISDINLNLSLIKTFIPILIANISFSAMTQLDMVLINWYFPSSQAGLYAAASVLGKAILYLPGGLIIVLFSLASEDHARGIASFSLLRQALLVTMLVCGSIAAFYWVFADSIILILYGEDYDGAGYILRWYSLAILPLTIVLITEQYLIANGKTFFSYIFLFMLPIQIFLISVWHTEIWMILIIMGFFGIMLAIIGYFFFAIRKLT